MLSFSQKILIIFRSTSTTQGWGVQIKVDRLGFVPYTESIHNILKFIHITVGKFSIHFADDRVRTFRFRFLAQAVTTLPTLPQRLPHSDLYLSNRTIRLRQPSTGAILLLFQKCSKNFIPCRNIKSADRGREGVIKLKNQPWAVPQNHFKMAKTFFLVIFNF